MIFTVLNICPPLYSFREQKNVSHMGIVLLGIAQLGTPNFSAFELVSVSLNYSSESEFCFMLSCVNAWLLTL